jgi:biopolymer transport protein ExbD
MKYPRNTKIFRGQLDAAPFAGVFFLLVLMLVVSSRLVFTPGVRVDLPQARVSLPGADRAMVVVAVDLGGQYYYRNQVITEEKLLEELRQALDQAREPLSLLILADRMARLESAVRLLSMARELGFEQAWMGARPPPSPVPVRH